MKRSTKKAIGATMLIIIFLSMLAVMSYHMGFLQVVVMIIIAVIIASLIIVALNLISS